MKRISLFLCLLLVCISLKSQTSYMYRLILKDKGNPVFSTEQPEMFLSQKSIDRRTLQGLSIDETDLPIDPAYFEAISHSGANIRTYSKWIKTVVVHVQDTLPTLSSLRNLPFVDSLYCVWQGDITHFAKGQDEILLKRDAAENDINSYGAGFTQISINNGHLLHDAGFRGEGVEIAVIDGGFTNVDKIGFFDYNKIIEVKNFNHDTSDPLRGSFDHGTKVLSCLLPDKTGELVGTAPDATYRLFRTEVGDDEFPVEEDYWISALEYADSVGVDVITSSLGYFTFDDPTMNHTTDQLDGKTIPISRAAALAASRGILLFSSAGNEGRETNAWKKIIFPADADHVITVGSIMSDSVRSEFSSLGYTADERVKPDLMAMGTQVAIIDYSGGISRANGTSFSTPVLAGLGACLRGAFPKMKCTELIRLLQESGDIYHTPNTRMGYGIPDVYKVFSQVKTDIKPISKEPDCFFINSHDNRLYLNTDNPKKYEQSILTIYSSVGMKLISISHLSTSIDISFLPRGIYIVSLQIEGKPYTRKFIKM